MWHEISAGKNIPDLINVIIEIPKGSLNKYEIDKETGLIKLDRVMFTGQDYPFDYGFVPQTHWHDGDPLDVVLITTYPLVPGLLMAARPVGVMDMIDDGESDAKDYLEKAGGITELADEEYIYIVKANGEAQKSQ